MNGKNNCFSDFIIELPTISKLHKRDESIHTFLQKCFKNEVKRLFQNDEKDLYPFGNIKFPYYKMGNVDTTNLFDLDEMIIFSFYWKYKDRYSNVADLGANAGLHSLLLSKCGFNIKAYEPDPWHFEILTKNIIENECKNVELFNAAVSNCDGRAEFVKVLGNTMSSHIKGSKSNPYGELETYEVELINFKNIIKWADFIKMDVEGHETVLLLSTTSDDWTSTDAMIEISNKDNAIIVFDYMKKIGVKMYSQKNYWNEVITIDNMPENYKEGSLFISNNNLPFVQE